MINSLIGIGVFVVAIVAAVWLIIMHSPLPLRFVTNLIEEGGAASNLKITGVSGSLSSGLSFKNVQWNDGEITDLRFRYSGIMDVIRRKNQHIRAEGANLAEFIDAPLPNKLDLDISIAKTETADSILTVRGGSFLLGTHIFTIQPTTVTGPERPPEATPFLVALGTAGDTEIRFEIPVTETEEPEQSHTPILTSSPAMQPEDLMALLFHDQKFSDLPPPDQEKLRKNMTWFFFSR